MCGIAGYFSRSRQDLSLELKKGVRCLSHRGPDTSATKFFDGVGLGHARLKIIDLSDAANQPMESANGEWAIVFNGEIYNYRELAKRHNLALNTTSDTEVIAEMLALKGISAVHEFNGMFAIGAYYKPDKKLFLIRDRLGIKPLYYFSDKDKVIFASELKSIYQFQADLSLSDQSIFDFLHIGMFPGNSTVYNEVWKVGAGCWLEVSEGKVESYKYWDVEPFITNPGQCITYQDAIDEVKSLLEDSVRKRLIADVTTGTFLSGGVDSSLVSALATEVQGRIRTFNISFPDEGVDESGYAGKVADHIGSEHFSLAVTSEDARKMLEDIIGGFDEPFADTSALPTWFVSKLAKEHAGVALSGDGGDELCYGYNSYRWARRFGVPGFGFVSKAAVPFLKRMGSREKRVAELMNFKGNEPLSYHIFSQEQYYHSLSETAAILKNSDLPVYPSESKDLLRNQNRFDIKKYLSEDLLTKVDRTSMMHGLEVRVPLLDHRVVEFCLSLPSKYKMKGNNQKLLLKDLLLQYFPEEIVNRPKWGFSIPLNTWLKKDLKYLLEYLSPENIHATGILDEKVVSRIVNRFLEGETYLYNRIWLLIVLQKFILEKKWK